MLHLSGKSALFRYFNLTNQWSRDGCTCDEDILQVEEWRFQTLLVETAEIFGLDEVAGATESVGESVLCKDEQIMVSVVAGRIVAGRSEFESAPCLERKSK